MKRLIALFLAFAMLTCLFIGCSSSSTPAPSTTASSGAASPSSASPSGQSSSTPATEPSNITFWYWADTPEQSQLMQSIVENYNQTNTQSVTVTAEENAWNSGAYVEDMYVAVAGGGGPDVSTFKLSGASMYNNGGYLLDLTDYVNTWDYKNAINDSIWNAISQATATEGQYFLAPWTYETLYVYYRPSYFEKAGVNVPTTYEEFMEAIQKCTMDTDGDGKTDVYGLSMRGPGGHEPWYYFLNMNGGSFEDLTGAGSVAGMEAMKSIYTNGYAPATAVTDAYSEIMATFKAGQSAMVIHHIGSYKNMVETFGDDVAAFTLPASKSGNAWNTLSDTDLVAMANTKYPDACWDFLSYMSYGEGQAMWFEGTGKSNMNDAIIALDDFSSNAFLQTCLQGLDNAGTFPFTATSSEFISTAWTQYMQSYMLGEISAADALAQMNSVLYGK